MYLRLNLGKGTSRDAKKMQKLAFGIAIMTFRNVTRHRQGRFSQLRIEAKQLFPWHPLQCRVKRFNYVHRLLPNDQLSI